MPKMKTHKGTAKRFRVTGSGKIMRAKAFKSHIKTKKSPKRIRNFAMRPNSPQQTVRSSARTSVSVNQGVIVNASCKACSFRP